MTKRKGNAEPTLVSLVLAELRSSEDFLSPEMMVQRIKRITKHQVQTSCWLLRQYRCVDVVINPDGSAWWFALDPALDTRQRIVEGRTPEVSPRKTGPRKRKVKP